MTKIGNKITTYGSLIKNNSQLNITAEVSYDSKLQKYCEKNNIQTNLKIGGLYKLVKSNINDVNNTRELSFTTNTCQNILAPTLPATIEPLDIKLYDHILNGDCVVTLLKVQSVLDIHLKLSNPLFDNKVVGSFFGAPEFEEAKTGFVNACVFQHKESIYVSKESSFKECFELLS